MNFSALLGELLLGWLAADFLGGLFHWWEDRVGRRDLPFVGPWIVVPNRLHHADQLAFTRGTFLERNLAVMVTALCVGGAWALLFGVSAGLIAAVVGGALQNEVHAWAHRPTTAPAWVRTLQDTGLLQSPKHHAGHHRPPSDRRYCVLTDWLNPLLDAAGLWHRLEDGLTRIGLEPNRGTR